MFFFLGKSEATFPGNNFKTTGIETRLTEHGLQADQTCDKIVKVDIHVFLGVAQDDQLEQVVIQLET